VDGRELVRRLRASGLRVTAAARRWTLGTAKSPTRGISRPTARVSHAHAVPSVREARCARPRRPA